MGHRRSGELETAFTLEDRGSSGVPSSGIPRRQVCESLGEGDTRILRDAYFYLFFDISDCQKTQRKQDAGGCQGTRKASSLRLNATFHGPAIISDDGKTAYAGYGPAVVILDISDISKPNLVRPTSRVSPPFGAIPAHDVLPIPGKNLLFLHGEMTGEGDEPNGPLACTGIAAAAMIDIKDRAKPFLISIFPQPEPPKGAPYKDFCEKGGRFGPHNPDLKYLLPDVQKQADLVYLTYFNAGLRIYDIKNPRAPKRGRLVYAADADQTPRPASLRQAREPDRGRARRHSRQYLYHRQAVGRFCSALHGSRSTKADGEMKYRRTRAALSEGCGWCL